MNTDTGLVRYDDPAKRERTVPVPYDMVEKARELADKGISLMSDQHPYPEVRNWAIREAQRIRQERLDAEAAERAELRRWADVNQESRWVRGRTPKENEERKRILKEKRRIQKQNKQRNRR